MVYYTTWGSVCGACGHAHKSEDAALACLERHQQACEKQGGYSDRHVRRLEGREELKGYYVDKGPGEPLDE
jgi:hypothetical protein